MHQPSTQARTPRKASGALTAAILTELKAAGEAGLRVNDLSAKLGIPGNRLSSWLSTKGKRVPEIERIAPGTYRFNPGLYQPCPPSERRTIKQQVLSGLPAAGEAGIKVKALAAKLGVTRTCLNSWFSTKGKRVLEIERIARGTYRYNPGSYQPCQPYKQRSKLKPEVISHLQAAGEGGVKVKVLAAKLGIPRNHLSIWLSTTGKRVPEIELIAPATYRFNPGGYSPIPRYKRRKIKPEVMSHLQAAGEGGVKVKALATTLGVTQRYLNTWFSVTGKRVPGIERIARGTFRFNPGSYQPSLPYMRRSNLKQEVISALQAAGEAGLRVKDLTSKLGCSNQTDLFSWFSITRKRVPEIERIAPGTYRFNPGLYQPCPPSERRTIKQQVLAGLQGAGEAGIKVKALAAKLGMSNRKLGSWFSLEVVRVPEIERMSRGVYRIRPAA